MLEDPSNQFIYTANFNDSTVVGKIIDERWRPESSSSGCIFRSFGQSDLVRRERAHAVEVQIDSWPARGRP